MLLLMFLACFGQKPKTISEKETIVISFAENLSTEQQRVAIIIENELKFANDEIIKYKNEIQIYKSIINNNTSTNSNKNNYDVIITYCRCFDNINN